MNKKLTKIEEYINNSLIDNLPVNYRFLDYFDLKKDSITYIKYVEVAEYFTSKYEVSNHYKPISKFLEIVK